MEPGGSRFRHEARLHQGVDGFAAGIARFVRGGLEAGEAVLVAAIEHHAGPLHAELRSDAAEVELLAVAEIGRSPARIIPAWRDWVERTTAGATALPGVGEPVWAGRSELEVRECQTCEHLLNPAFDAGPG